jgi:hypothetical protein
MKRLGLALVDWEKPESAENGVIPVISPKPKHAAQIGFPNTVAV